MAVNEKQQELLTRGLFLQCLSCWGTNFRVNFLPAVWGESAGQGIQGDGAGSHKEGKRLGNHSLVDSADVNWAFVSVTSCSEHRACSPCERMKPERLSP